MRQLCITLNYIVSFSYLNNILTVKDTLAVVGFYQTWKHQLHLKMFSCLICPIG